VSSRARLGAFVLLAGTMREGILSKDASRSPLDLPLRDGETVLQAWCRHGAALAVAMELGELSMRVLVNRGARLPERLAQFPGVRLSVEYDANELRGTAGVLRDVSEGMAPEDLMLVGNAYQFLDGQLAEAVTLMQRTGGDVTLLSGDNGEPHDLKLIRRRALEPVKAKGFVDFKEQALPQIARSFDVRVAVLPGTALLAVRTLEGYIGTLKKLHRAPGEESDPLAEDWYPTFAIAEPGAQVAGSARVHDSVVLRGGVVEGGAVVVRSLVCDGGVVGPGDVVFDRVVTGGRAREGAP
jgi:NDP-sugar pyrophosphorylase family protein